MTLFLIIYLIGYFVCLISLLLQDEPEYVTLGDLILYLFESLFSWVTIFVLLITILIDNWDKIIIKK